MDLAVEHVARAFYDAEGDGNSWASEPDILKDEFRHYARAAIALLQKYADEKQQAAAPDLAAAA